MHSEKHTLIYEKASNPVSTKSSEKKVTKTKKNELFSGETDGCYIFIIFYSICLYIFCPSQSQLSFSLPIYV